MRFFAFILLYFNLFASTPTWTGSGYLTPYQTTTFNASHVVANISEGYTSPFYYSNLWWLYDKYTNVIFNADGTKDYTKTSYWFTVTSQCNLPYVANPVTKVCEIPPCGWATTPPWYPYSGLDSVSCRPVLINYLYADNQSHYVSNAQYCQEKNTCYVKLFPCPLGQNWDKNKAKCVAPIPPETCESWYVSTFQSISSTGEKCTKTWTCKTNSSLTHSESVSCGVTAADTASYNTPTGETSDTPQPSSNQPQKPTPSSTPSPSSTPMDNTNTTAATSSDIANSANKLSTDIEKSLRTYLTDGTTSHLQYIRDAMDIQLDQQFTSNTHLESLKSSADASLVLQSESNTKLDRVNQNIESTNLQLTESNSKLGDIKSSINENGSRIDGTNTRLDTLNAIQTQSNAELSESKSFLQKISDFFTDDQSGTYEGDTSYNQPDTNADPDGSFSASIGSMTSDISSIGDQFSQVKNIVSGNIPAPSFSSGSCPTLDGPLGTSVNLNKIAQVISPYSSIFSILIYISIMIATFRSVFNFLSRGAN